MKKSILYSLLLIVCVACGGGDDAGGGNSPQPSKDYLSVTPNLELLGDGQTTDITIDANCSWTISKDVDWLTVSPMSGSNKQTVTIAAMKNSTGADRMAILTVQGGTLPVRRVTVTQRKSSDTPVQKSLSVNPNSLEFEANGGNQDITITSNTSWTITCPDWCTLSKTSGSDNATITVTVGKNEKTEKRDGQIVVSGEGVNTVNVNVSQKAGTNSSPNPDDNLPPS